MTDIVRDLVSELQSFGAPPEGVISLHAALSPDHIDQLDLVRGDAPVVDAIVKLAGRAVLYVVRGRRSSAQISRLQHLLTQRGAADHLAILEPGVLTVYPVAGSKQALRSPMPWHVQAGSRGRIPELAWGKTADDARGAAGRLHGELLKLLNSTTNEITNAGVSPQDALSLVGRALFFRFLADRNIVSEQQHAMMQPAQVQATSEWLHETFNGNLLLLEGAESPAAEDNDFWEQFWSKLGKRRSEKVCGELTKILHKTEWNGQYRFAWDTLDFGHIPVGLLSQVYEAWYHKYASAEAAQDSVWYTPRAIAEYMTAEAFFDLPNAYAARVMDPAVGAGVFLVTAYRELVAARWRHDGKRPDKTVLREILYKQLVGFDVNEAALRLTALSLYLTALELDPSPQPHRNLRFKDLRKVGVLRDVRDPSDHQTGNTRLPPIGSLGPHLSAREHRGRYDIVLGNPPWTSWTSSELSRDPKVAERRKAVELLIGPIVRERTGDPEAKFAMVDNNPDLPFLWRAMEWAKPDGVISLALHTRLLFKTTEATIHARNQLFRAFTVTGILNGAALSQTSVWPSQEAPFCILFASNRSPKPGEGFHFVSPLADDVINRRGHVRIDPHAAYPVFPDQLERHPWLLKTLFRGTPLDVPVMEQIIGSTPATIGDLGLSSSRGYVVGGARSRKAFATHLDGLPKFGSEECKRLDTPRISASALPEIFNAREPVTEPRAKAQGAFLKPLVLVAEAPRHGLDAPRAFYSDQSLAYDGSFYGFSTSSVPQADLLARYLLIIFNSRIALYFLLMRSPMFGAQRKRVELSDLRAIPVRRIEDMALPLKRNIRDLSETILESSQLPQGDIDRFIGETLGLSRPDLQVIEDTLSVSLPFRECLNLAQKHPTNAELEAFRNEVEGIMAPILRHLDRRVSVELLPHEDTGPWIWFSIRTDHSSPGGLAGFNLDEVQHWALKTGASRLVSRGENPGQLLIGIFAQYRYFTRTQARMLALDVLGSAEHEAWLRGMT